TNPRWRSNRFRFVSLAKPAVKPEIASPTPDWKRKPPAAGAASMRRRSGVCANACGSQAAACVLLGQSLSLRHPVRGISFFVVAPQSRYSSPGGGMTFGGKGIMRATVALNRLSPILLRTAMVVLFAGPPVIESAHAEEFERFQPSGAKIVYVSSINATRSIVG